MYLGIDLGTGSVKVALHDGISVRAATSVRYTVEAPQPGYAQTDPNAWVAAIAEAVDRLGQRPTVEVVGLAAQMHGVVPVDRTGRTLGPAILWADQRGREMLPQFERLPEDFLHRLGNAPSAGMAATTLLWLKRHQPDLYAAADCFLFPKDYIRWVLTGELATDYSDASGSALYDFEARGWFAELLDSLNLDPSKLPPIRRSTDIAGTVHISGARRTHIPAGVPVAVGSADAVAAMVGGAAGSSLLGADTDVQMIVGTAAQIGLAVNTVPPFHPGLNLFEGVEPPVRYRFAAMLNAGLALEWVRALLHLEWDELYARLAGGAELPRDLLFLPYLTGERTPYMNPNARGAWIGLSLHHDRYDMLAAAVLGVACSLRLGMDALVGSTASPKAQSAVHSEAHAAIRLVGGSAQHGYWRSLIAAAVGRPMYYTHTRDASVQGAVRIAAHAVGTPIQPATAETVPIEPLDVPWIESSLERFIEAYSALNPVLPQNP